MNCFPSPPEKKREKKKQPYRQYMMNLLSCVPSGIPKHKHRIFSLFPFMDYSNTTHLECRPYTMIIYSDNEM